MVGLRYIQKLSLMLNIPKQAYQEITVEGLSCGLDRATGAQDCIYRIGGERGHKSILIRTRCLKSSESSMSGLGVAQVQPMMPRTKAREKAMTFRKGLNDFCCGGQIMTRTPPASLSSNQ